MEIEQLGMLGRAEHWGFYKFSQENVTNCWTLDIPSKDFICLILWRIRLGIFWWFNKQFRKFTPFHLNFNAAMTHETKLCLISVAANLFGLNCRKSLARIHFTQKMMGPLRTIDNYYTRRTAHMRQLLDLENRKRYWFEI